MQTKKTIPTARQNCLGKPLAIRSVPGTGWASSHYVIMTSFSSARTLSCYDTGRSCSLVFTLSPFVRHVSRSTERNLAKKMRDDVSLIMLGDLMLGRIVNAALGSHGVRQVWGNFLPLLTGALAENQIVSGNLECAITTHDEKYPKEFNFKLDPANVHTLRVASVDFVSLANNHILDFNAPGLVETQKVLQDNGIKFAGAGTKKEAQKPAVITKGRQDFAFFSFSDHYENWAATDETPGINFINPEDYNVDQFKPAFDAARARGVNWIVVFIHWGPNWKWYPSDKIVQLGHSFIDCGADIVFGHSAHHMQGVEVYNDRPIIYGAGGFIDDYALDQNYRNDLGFMYCIKIANDKMESLDMYPSKINHIRQEEGEQPPYITKVMKATERDYGWACYKMKNLCRFFGTKLEETSEGLSIPLDCPMRKGKVRTPRFKGTSPNA